MVNAPPRSKGEGEGEGGLTSQPPTTRCTRQPCTQAQEPWPKCGAFEFPRIVRPARRQEAVHLFLARDLPSLKHLAVLAPPNLSRATDEQPHGSVAQVTLADACRPTLVGSTSPPPHLLPLSPPPSNSICGERVGRRCAVLPFWKERVSWKEGRGCEKRVQCPLPSRACLAWDKPDMNAPCE